MSNSSEGWTEKTLGDLATLRRGITYLADMLVEKDAGVPYVNMKSFKKGGGFNKDGLKFFNGPFLNDDLTAATDLLIANTDVTLSGDIIGIPAYLPVHIRKNPVLFSHHVTRIKLNSNEVNSHYLYYLLNIDEYRRWMHKFARGTTVLMLDMTAIKRIPIRYPSCEKIQKKIVKKLEIFDEAIEKTEALIHKYQQIKAGLMHDLFTRGLTADGKLRPPREQAPELYRETPIGWIPKEWDYVQISDLCSQVVDCPHSTPSYQDSGIPCIRTADMKPGQLLLEQAYRVNQHDYLNRIQRLNPKKGDIIYSREGERLGIASPVGREKVCLGQRVMLLRPADKVDPHFLLWSMNLPDFYRRVVRGLGATTSPHVNVGDIKNILTYRPPEKEQIFIGKSIRTVQTKLLDEERYKKKLITQKSGLMHDLLTGKVPVKLAQAETAHV